MSDMNESGFTPEQNNPETVDPGPAPFDLGPSPWAPTQPASQYVGPLPGQPEQPVPPYGQSMSAYGQSVPAYGQPMPAYGQPQEYQNYSPQGEQPYAPAQPYPSAPPYMQAQIYPPMQPYVQTQAYPAMYPGPPPLAPGQVVQTPYGTFTVGPKSKLAAGLLGIFLGGFGVGRFYRGHVGIGVAQLVVTLFTGGIGWIWGIIDGILVLVAQPGSQGSLDSNNQIMI